MRVLGEREEHRRSVEHVSEDVAEDIDQMTDQREQDLHVLRHSTAHVMA